MRHRYAVTLLELIIAIAVLGLLAALAIPRFSRAAAPPDVTNVLRADLRVLRVAIDLYQRDHGVYPAQRSDGRAAAGTPNAFVSQLTHYTDARGHVSDTPDEEHCFGPYLRDGVPPCPVARGPHAHAVHVIQDATSLTDVAGSVPGGWIYNPETGHIIANSAESNARGRPYAFY